MGQSQSTGSKGPQEQQSARKTDYYELLGVAPAATDDEIKKAYRKKALELHPDRNYGNAEEATKLFAEIQSAYEVLADPQERAWYDSHSDAFLGTNGGSEGDQHSYNIRITTAEDVLKVFAKFSPRMEFSDSPSGFFGGLGDQFSQLALEERLACQWEDQDMVDYPPFGTQADDFESVVRPFYAAWSGFSTRKSFSWKDAYRLSDAPDRRVRRLMEKENRRLRDEAIREFNDAVRSLVAFVKKRDPRYKANALNEAQRQETLRQSVAAQAARSRAMNQAKMRDHIVPQWAQSEEPVADNSQETSESEVESFECVACKKQFKSQKQFEAHERSKKHLKAVKQLRREMLLENEQLDLKPAVQVDAYRGFEGINDRDNDHDGDDSDHCSGPVGTQPDSSAVQEDGYPQDTLSISRSNLSGSVSEDEKSIEDEDYVSRETIETRLRSDFDPLLGDDSIPALTEQLSSSALNDAPAAPQVGKAKQKRAKKAARKTEKPGGGYNPSHAQPIAGKEEDDEVRSTFISWV
ncbi:Heat shock protein DnaJ N-terminal [Penicillium maclennaniae]|uniref:Heat shock protein DnaJ N-terminal n=1 Tax=Penicillium maclennaniae TaxID=1343394 RepID=UPI0025413B52|nr:Heat shock protein DnaJ N-terminal [Penicillium maclennaniae]KAJ5667925.1 Heat shock protein DnaJ N-terminal [Penicillium maclennaniae]